MASPCWPWSALVTLILCITITKGTNNKNLHHHMSIEDIRRTFHVQSHNQVPDYEVVAVRALSKRSSGQENEEPSLVAHLEAFGKPLQLELQRTRTLSKSSPPSTLRMWAADPNHPHGVHLSEIPQAEHDVDIGHTYQDEINEAALLVHTNPQDGTLIVEGTIGKDLIVRPLPQSVKHLVDEEESNLTENEDDEEDDDDVDPNDDEMFLDQEPGQEVAVSSGFPLPPEKPAKKKASQIILNITNNKTKSRSKRSAARVGMHVVIKRQTNKNTEEDSLSDYAFMEPDHISKRFRERRSLRRRSRSGRDAPYVIYPEILVIVDYDGYRLHGGDNVQIKRYFVSFWNGVDLRYKLLKGPKVRISIAGIIISRGRDATPYLERNRVGRDAIDSAAALTDMGKYLFRERRLPVYDIAVAITKYDMCRRRKGGRCTKGTAGFAYVGGACVVNKRLEKVNSVAIIEDTGGFSGIIVAAHEVGHLLGAVHDGSPPPSYLGGPGAEKCRWEDGFIMSDLRHTEKGFRWSPCSVSSFHHFLNGETATCLFNAPHEDDALPRVLPGKLLSLDAQCRKDRGTSACFKDERVCAQLFCFDANSGYCVAYRPAAEGSPCGDGQSCLNGRCVAEHENIIPDYTQITPSYARPDPAATQARPVYAEAPYNITTRSPWANFWSTSSPTTSSSTSYSSNYNPYQTTTPLSTSIDPYSSSSINPWYHTTPSTSSTYWYQTSPSTTSSSSTLWYQKSSIPWYQSSTSTNNYDWYNNPSSNTKSTNKNDYNPYSKSSTYNYISTTTTTTTPSTVNNYTKINPYQSAAIQGDIGNEDLCEDKPAKSANSMNCVELLNRYPLQYCGSYYIKKQCCASMRRMCPSQYQKQ